MSEVLCGRVGCGEPAIAVLLMSPQDTQAWIVSPDHPSAPEGVPLCPAHADRISVPFGWSLADERPAPKKRRRRKKAAPPVEPVEDAEVVAVAPVSAAEPSREPSADAEVAEASEPSREPSADAEAAEASEPDVAEPAADAAVAEPAASDQSAEATELQAAESVESGADVENSEPNPPVEASEAAVEGGADGAGDVAGGIEARPSASGPIHDMPVTVNLGADDTVDEIEPAVAAASEPVVAADENADDEIEPVVAADAEPDDAVERPAAVEGPATEDTVQVEHIAVVDDPGDDYVEPEYQFREDGRHQPGYDEPTIQMPAVRAGGPSAPAEVPLDADRVAAAVDEETPRLSVVPGDDDPRKTYDFSDDGQGAFWHEPEPTEPEPDERTPLLQRAFRVVRDD